MNTMTKEEIGAQRMAMFRALNGRGCLANRLSERRLRAAGPAQTYEMVFDGERLTTVANNEAAARGQFAWQLYGRMRHRWDLRTCHQRVARETVQVMSGVAGGRSDV